MRVLQFSSREANCVQVGGDPYFLYAPEGHPPLLCGDRCPHRGGPLHLGTADPHRGRLVCPWHETVFTRRALERRSAPMVRVGFRITAIFDGPADGPAITFAKRRIIANERP